MIAQFQEIFEQFEPIGLAEMNEVRLMNRTDTKFVMATRHLRAALPRIRENYWILSVDGVRMSRYRSLYFDTRDFMLYLHHHNDWGNRYKVRCREYVDSGVSYLEVKHKTPKRRTVKNRMKIPGIITEIDSEAKNFLSQYYPHDLDALDAKIWNSFVRITLINKAAVERLTIDLDVESRWDSVRSPLTGIVIAEIKQEKFSVRSPFFAQMRTMHILPMGFSKYCVGMSALYPHLKKNRFKRRTLHLERLRHHRF